MSKLQRVMTQEVPVGIYRIQTTSTPNALKKEAARAGWLLFVLDGTKIRDKQSFLKNIAQVMKFPSYFGMNWDALNDCLTDMEWARAKGYVLLYQSPEGFIENSPDEWKVAEEILDFAIDFWRGVNVPFYVLLRGPTVNNFADV